jgi:[protein-PII] uridylyltransferase
MGTKRSEGSRLGDVVPGGDAIRRYAIARGDLLAASVSSGEVSGRHRRRALADLADVLLIDVLKSAEITAGETGNLALVAVGGYGRAELSPGSDLDILVLHRPDAPVSEIVPHVLYPLWDSSVRLDHAVRTVDDTVDMAATDLKVAMGLLDARHIAGDPTLTMDLRARVLTAWRTTAARRLPELRRLGEERAALIGELPFLLEPDLKEARGGLRDIVALRAIAASWLADLPRGRIAAAHELLLDTRDALHTVTDRVKNRLVLQEQDPVAVYLGYSDADALMRRVYDAARTVMYTADLTWRRVSHLTSARRRGVSANRGPLVRKPLGTGVVEHDGEVALALRASVEDPVVAWRVASTAALSNLPIAPYALQRLATHSEPLTRPWPPAARSALLGVLGAGEGTVQVWEAFDQAGLISRFIPEWARIRSQPQRNPLHKFTVDRHLVETAVQASALTRWTSRPDLLLVAAIFHDLGKGLPGDHSEVGSQIAKNIAADMGFPPEDIAIVELLVRHHLLLVDTASHRDLDDPRTIQFIIEVIPDVGALDLLHALTVADALATGPAVWSAWRADLVANLVQRVRQVMAGAPIPSVPQPSLEYRQQATALRDTGDVVVQRGPPVPGPYSELTVLAADRRGLLAATAGVLAVHRRSVLSARTWSGDGSAVLAIVVDAVSADSLDLAAVGRDIRRALDGSGDVGPALARRDSAVPRGSGVAPARADIVIDASASATVLEVRAHDRPGLLHSIADAIASRGVDVSAALVSTLGTEVVDVFYLHDGNCGNIAQPSPLTAVDAERLRLIVQGVATG